MRIHILIKVPIAQNPIANRFTIQDNVLTGIYAITIDDSKVHSGAVIDAGAVESKL